MMRSAQRKRKRRKSKKKKKLRRRRMRSCSKNQHCRDQVVSFHFAARGKKNGVLWEEAKKKWKTSLAWLSAETKGIK
jgi:hypothetical protein